MLVLLEIETIRCIWLLVRQATQSYALGWSPGVRTGQRPSRRRLVRRNRTAAQSVSCSFSLRLN